MTGTGQAAAGLVLDLDPATWLPGPVGSPEPVEVARWIDRALAAVCSDFRVGAGSAEEAHLRTVLTAFVEAPLECHLRLLRLRAVDDVPLVVRVWALTEADRVGGGDPSYALTEFDPDQAWYDPEPRITDVTGVPGLRRAIKYAVDDDDGIRPVVRYHRHVPAADVDVVLACSGARLQVVAAALDDLDALARATWVVGEDGGRH